MMRYPENRWWEAGGVEGCLGAFQPFGAEFDMDAVYDLAQAKTITLTVEDGLEIAPDGWKADGAGYVQTDYRPTESHAVFLAYSGITASAGNGGFLLSNQNTDLLPRYSVYLEVSDNTYIMNKNDLYTLPGALASAAMAITEANAWVDKLKVKTWDLPGAHTPYWDHLLMSDMDKDTGLSTVPMVTGYLSAVAFYDPSPTDEQVVAILEAMETLTPWGYSEDIKALVAQLYNQRQDWAVVKHTEDRYIMAIYDAAHYAPELLWQRYYDTTLAGVDDQKSYTLPSPVTADNLRRVGIAGLQGYDFKGQWNAIEDAVQGDLIEFQAQPTVDAAIRLEYVLPPTYGKIDYIDREWLVCEAMVRLLMEADPLMEPAEKIHNDLGNWTSRREARYREMRKQQREYPARVKAQGVAQYGY